MPNQVQVETQDRLSDLPDDEGTEGILRRARCARDG